MALVDTFGRKIDYLRISITDHCNLNCKYCSPPFSGRIHLQRREILTYEEIATLAETAVAAGIARIRLTGGEPLIRNGVVDLCRLLAKIEGLESLSLTTNGVRLRSLAGPLSRAGVHRINVSLDSLKRNRFRQITGQHRLTEVLAGIEAAEAAGLAPIKINTVVMRGVNDDEVADLAALTFDKPYHVRFIELMPFQMSVLGFNTASVTSTNFLFNVTGTPGGIYRYIKEYRFAWPVALIIVTGIIPGVLLGYYFRILYLPDPEAFKIFVGIVLMLLALKLYKDLWTNKTAENEKYCNIPNGMENVSIGLTTGRFDFQGEKHSFSTAGLLGLSSAVGVIGGGSVIAPFFITFFHLPIYAVAGAVLLGTFASSVAGVTFYSMVPIHGAVAGPDWLLGILFGAGGLLGMYFGAKMQKYTSEKWIKLILASVVFIVAARYILIVLQ